MSRSIVYNGTDFSPWTTAEVSLPAAHGVAVEAAEVPGRPGAVLVGASVPPKPIGVRLFLDLEDDCDAEDLSEARHALAAALASTEGAELELPGEPGLSYRDVFCTDSSDWSHLFEDGSCELAFLALDPVAWGEEVASSTNTLTLGGTWPSFPVLTGTASAASALGFAEGPGLRWMSVIGPFEGGEQVVVDCGAGRVTVDGEAVDADVQLGSDFFALVPGSHSLVVAGFSSWTVACCERWL